VSKLWCKLSHDDESTPSHRLGSFKIVDRYQCGVCELGNARSIVCPTQEFGWSIKVRCRIKCSCQLFAIDENCVIRWLCSPEKVQRSLQAFPLLQHPLTSAPNAVSSYG
jgi:hypothetical protein